MKNYILVFSVLVLFALFTSSVFAQEQITQEQNIPHEIKVLKEEMKEMKHYLHELKEIIDAQNKVISTLTGQMNAQELEITIQKNKISEMNQKIELIKTLVKEVSSLNNEVEGLKNNSTIYVQKLDLLAFFESLDPNRVTVLQYLRNYGGWIVNHP